MSLLPVHASRPGREAVAIAPPRADDHDLLRLRRRCSALGRARRATAGVLALERDRTRPRARPHVRDARDPRGARRRRARRVVPELLRRAPRARGEHESVGVQVLLEPARRPRGGTQAARAGSRTAAIVEVPGGERLPSRRAVRRRRGGPLRGLPEPGLDRLRRDVRHRRRAHDVSRNAAIPRLVRDARTRSRVWASSTTSERGVESGHHARGVHGGVRGSRATAGDRAWRRRRDRSGA